MTRFYVNSGWQCRGLVFVFMLALQSVMVLAQEPDPLAPLPPTVQSTGQAVVQAQTSPDVPPAPSLDLAAPASTPPAAVPPVPPRAIRPEHNGYAFDTPPILLRQRLIGLAHGLRLLGRLCLFSTAHSASAEQAYAEWYRRQGPAIERMSVDLERWYFGATAPQLDPNLRLRDVIRALGLRAELREMSAAERDAACATFPLAISSERYDFVRLLQITDDELAPAVEPTTPITEPTPSPPLDDAALQPAAP